MVEKVSIWLVLEPLLFSEPKHLAQISKELRKSHTTVRKQLSLFESMGVVEKEKKGRQIFYKLREVPLLIDYLTIIEKEKLIKRSKEELLLKELVDSLHTFDNPIILFGSAVISIKNANDVDLVIMRKFNKDKMRNIEEKLNLKLHILNLKDIKDINET